jgi:hypothetical protein
MAEVLAPLSDTDPPKGPTYRQHWTSGGPWFWGLGEWKRMLVRSMRPHEAPAALSPRRDYIWELKHDGADRVV